MRIRPLTGVQKRVAQQPASQLGMGHTQLTTEAEMEV